MEDLKKSQNELNDILIKRESSEGGSLKNILLVVAALLLFVIIGILAYRIIDSGSKSDTMPIKNEPVSKYGSTSAPEVENPNKTLEDILAKHRSEKESVRSDDAIDKMVVEEKIDLKEPSKFVEINDEKPQVASKQPETKQPETKQTEVKKIEPKQPEAKKPEPKVAVAESRKGHFFVQVESLEKEPRSDYIKQLKSKGFGVVVKEKMVDGKKKKRVYVGPYSTREEAAAVLPKIKSEINPDAFVIQD